MRINRLLSSAPCWGERINTYCMAACCIGLLLLSGCGDGRPTRVPVSGRVLIDGKPLTFGSIMLVPENGRPSSGNLDEQGRFALSCYGDKDGATRGHHAVRVVAAQPLGGDAVRWLAPQKYADHTTSELAVDIDAPTDSLRIDLTWADTAPPAEKPNR